ncbi:MAG: sensor histidine kinase [Caulobacterales bacterium]|nr:sensor histidine kinase [Caulobacterales bacterium]
MAFKVAARTVLELGAELITSDAVAIYELVKNAIDARSDSGVTIEFCVLLKHADYIDAIRRLQASTREDPDADEAAVVNEVRTSVIKAMATHPDKALLAAFQAALGGHGSIAKFQAALTAAYAKHNWVEFRDTGRGMSRVDLQDAFLVIGTPSRRRSLDKAIAAGGEAEYLGEKGVGRLSAMRLGSRLQVTTAREDNKTLNLLSVDWRAFDDLDKMIEDIELKPTRGGAKPTAEWSGTTLRVSDLESSWTPDRIRDIAAFELSRLADPFTVKLRRYRMKVIFNRARIDIPRLDREIFKFATATAKGSYTTKDGPKLEISVSCDDLGKGNPPETRRYLYEKYDLRSLTKDASQEIASSSLSSVGPFTFEFYWYNRQLLRKQLSRTEAPRVAALQKAWAGIMLFRDGYRVFPYGDDTDDWLGLDRRALASGGYKLSKSQFIGRANISRGRNPQLVDQTSREGLKDCDEKTVLVETLRYIIQDRLKGFLDDVEDKHAPAILDFERAERRAKDLRKRTQIALKGLQKRHTEEGPVVSDLLEFFEEMYAYFEGARDRASKIEDERDRVLQLAGIGLMLEMVAHELARSTETTLGILADAQQTDLPDDVSALFTGLRDEMKSMNRRLRVLDPLSVSGRQRRETFDLVKLAEEILAGHKSQFARHAIKTQIHPKKAGPIMVHGVRGMFVQILENLIQNSVYWLDIRAEDEDDFQARIDIRFDDGPLISISDNGPGIAAALSEEVFTAFYSTKSKSTRQGLGLYIAQDCAKQNGLQLTLTADHRIHPDRLNTFVLETLEN